VLTQGARHHCENRPEFIEEDWPAMEPPLLVERRDRVLFLTLNRPAVRNALDYELLDRLSNALSTGVGDAGAVVLRGAGGRAFSAGFDLTNLTGGEDDRRADEAIGRAVSAIEDCPLPVIAELRGHCHGAAVEVALACDVRIAGDDLGMALRAVRLGVTYRFQLLARLTQICGLGRAQHLLFAMPVLDAGAALEWGLVGEVVAADGLESRVAAFAAGLAAEPRSALLGTKASFRMLRRRALDPQDLARAEELRRRSAVSPERKAALDRARSRTPGAREEPGG
jgi:enoyl-CoA hydratase/carnithine racemase